MLASASAFTITQFGISAFSAAPGGGYVAKTFNFYIFPEPFEGSNRRFTCEAASLAFLARQGFDFNACFYRGVPYLPASLRDAKLQREDRPPPADARGAPTLTERDATFVADLVAQVGAWLRAPDAPPTLALPPVNAYLRMLTYRELERPQFGGADGSPGFYVQRTHGAGPGGDWAALTLVRATAAEVAAFEAEQRAKRRADIQAAAGFTRVFEAMRDSGKPAVGHNAMFDVVYAMAAFASDRLPPGWPEFKALVRARARARAAPPGGRPAAGFARCGARARACCAAPPERR